MINTAALFKRLSHCLRLTRYTTVSFLVWSPEQVDKWRGVGVFVTGAVGGPHCDSSFLDFYPPPPSLTLSHASWLATTPGGSMKMTAGLLLKYCR